jgi:flagellar hook protein FlgE
MGSLLNVGASGMIAMSRGMGTVGNNIANSRTIGFKAQTATFSDSFYAESTKAANAVIQNQQGFGVKATATNTDWDNGALEETGIDTHLAIVGKGFLPVLFNGDLMYTRAADFSFVESSTTAGEYVLMRPNGSVLLDTTANTTAEIRFDKIPTSYSVGRDGTITVDSSTTQTNGTSIGIQTFGNPDSLERQESGLFTTTAGTVLATATPTTPGTNGAGYLLQGSIEQSNVDLITEFTNMIALHRAYQANSKTITTADSMMQDVINLKR